MRTAIHWLLYKPVPEDHYVFPDHYDQDAFYTALWILCQPTPWRRWVPMWFRRWAER